MAGAAVPAGGGAARPDDDVPKSMRGICVMLRALRMEEALDDPAATVVHAPYESRGLMLCGALHLSAELLLLAGRDRAAKWAEHRGPELCTPLARDATTLPAPPPAGVVGHAAQVVVGELFALLELGGWSSAQASALRAAKAAAHTLAPPREPAVTPRGTCEPVAGPPPSAAAAHPKEPQCPPAAAARRPDEPPRAHASPPSRAVGAPALTSGTARAAAAEHPLWAEPRADGDTPDEHRRCMRCGEVKSRGAFTYRQWRGFADGRRCVQCQQANVAAMAGRGRARALELSAARAEVSRWRGCGETGRRAAGGVASPAARSPAASGEERGPSAAASVRATWRAAAFDSTERAAAESAAQCQWRTDGHLLRWEWRSAAAERPRDDESLSPSDAGDGVAVGDLLHAEYAREWRRVSERPDDRLQERRRSGGSACTTSPGAASYTYLYGWPGPAPSPGSGPSTICV